MSDIQTDIYNVLKKKRTFEHMPEEMFKKLIDIMTIIRFKSGHELLKEGETNAYIYILIKGTVSVYVGDEFIYFMSRMGDVFGEMSFLKGELCTATVQAEGEVVALQISKTTLEKIEDVYFYKWLCMILVDKLTRTSKITSSQLYKQHQKIRLK